MVQYIKHRCFLIINLVSRYSSDDYYEGYLKDSLRDGHGVLKCGRFLQSAASIYVGQWVNDKKHGYGVMDDIEQGKLDT